MHDTAFDFIARTVEASGLAAGSILEVGSGEQDNGGYGSQVRNLFTGPYFGIDRVSGPGVDAVMDIETTVPACGPFDTVLSAEMMEHTPHPWVAMNNMAQALKPGGHLIVTCRGYDDHGYAPVHMAPWDFWRFSVQGMVHLLHFVGLRVIRCSPDPHEMWRGVLAHAVKP